MGRTDLCAVAKLVDLHKSAVRWVGPALDGHRERVEVEGPGEVADDVVATGWMDGAPAPFGVHDVERGAWRDHVRRGLGRW